MRRLLVLLALVVSPSLPLAAQQEGPEHEPDTTPGHGLLNLGIGHVGISFGNSARWTGLRLNVRDRGVQRIDGINLTFWKAAKDANREAVINGVAIGLVGPEAGSLNGISIGLVGALADRRMTGLNLGGLGLVSSGSIDGLNLGGLGLVADGPVHGINVAGLGAVASGGMGGINVAGLGVVADRGVTGLTAAGLGVVADGGV